MNRFTRRTLGIGMGLCIGWYMAGLVGFADASAEHGADQTQADKSADHGSAHDKRPNPALALRTNPKSAVWLAPVRNGIIALFGLAIILGIPTLKLRGPDPPDPAEHLAHGDDDHEDEQAAQHH